MTYKMRGCSSTFTQGIDEKKGHVKGCYSYSSAAAFSFPPLTSVSTGTTASAVSVTRIRAHQTAAAATRAVARGGRIDTVALVVGGHVREKVRVLEGVVVMVVEIMVRNR